MVQVNPVKTLECIGRYKNNKGTFNIHIKSAAPRKYNLDCFSHDKDGNIVAGYGETFNDDSVEKFTEWSKAFIDKLKRYSEDSDAINKVSEFFKGISK